MGLVWVCTRDGGAPERQGGGSPLPALQTSAGRVYKVGYKLHLLRGPHGILSCFLLEGLPPHRLRLTPSDWSYWKLFHWCPHNGWGEGYGLGP